ncbi:type IV pilin [Haloarchaeobius baliensis]|uniref:type IV pilin n=1 Tax=Haloarchaeobius baliensis TaxID=1670458 RepID=UPI003F883892
MLAARAVSPVVGIVLLLALTIVASSVVAVGTLDLASEQTAPPRATFDATADPTTGRITITHRGGGAVDVDELRLVVTVDGEELRHQPPVPFFSARGFVSGPTGPFNVAADQRWTAGETASFTVAGTNEPTVSRGAVVAVTVVVGGQVVAHVRAIPVEGTRHAPVERPGYRSSQSVVSSGSTLSAPPSRSPATSGVTSSSGSTFSAPPSRSPATSGVTSSSGSTLSAPPSRSPTTPGSVSSVGLPASGSWSPGTRATVVMATSGS